MDAINRDESFLADACYPDVNFAVILDAADDWFDEWQRFFQLAFEEAGLHYTAPKFQSALSSRFLECMKWSPEDVQEWLADYDRETKSLANYLLGPEILRHVARRDKYSIGNRCGKKKWIQFENDGNIDEVPSPYRNEGNVGINLLENRMFEVLRKNLDRYAQQKLKSGNDTMSQQTALQLYQSLKDAPEVGIQRTIDWLLGTIGTCNPNDEPVDLLWKCHEDADKEYQRKNDEYAKYCERSGRETNVYQKYERKQLKNAYYRLFCPLRDVDVLYRLLHLSTNKAYQYPSRYRRKFLQSVLLPEFKKELNQWEEIED